MIVVPTQHDPEAPSQLPRTRRNVQLVESSKAPFAGDSYGILIEPPSFEVVGTGPPLGPPCDVEAFIDGDPSDTVILKLGSLYRGHFRSLTVKSLPLSGGYAYVDITTLPSPQSDVTKVSAPKPGASSAWSTLKNTLTTTPSSLAMGSMIAGRTRCMLVADKANTDTVLVSGASAMPAGQSFALSAGESLTELPIGQGVTIWAKANSGTQYLWLFEF